MKGTHHRTVVFGIEHTISARQKFYQADFIEEIMEDNRIEMLIRLAKRNTRSCSIEWFYLGRDVKTEVITPYLDWKDVPKTHDTIIRLRIEEPA